MMIPAHKYYYILDNDSNMTWSIQAAERIGVLPNDVIAWYVWSSSVQLHFNKYFIDSICLLSNW